LLRWVGDDSFMDVRAWIVTRGRAVLDRVIEDPDSLVEVAADQDNAFVESYGGLVYRAYKDATGQAPPRTAPAGAVDLTGVRVNLKDEQAVRAHFPRLIALRAAAHGSGDSPGAE
jgi:hypothetical protein